jgi:hypothetical protein
MATVNPMGEDPEVQIAVLQNRVRERLAELRPIRPGAEAYGRATDAVIEATTALIDYEERVPLLLDQAPRRLSLLIVRWSGLVPTAVGLALTVAAVAGWLARWWLLMVIVLFAVAAVLLRLRVPGLGKPHLALRPGALLSAAGALLIGIGAALGLPLWLAGIGLLLLLAGLWHCHHYATAPPSGRPMIPMSRQ